MDQISVLSPDDKTINLEKLNQYIPVSISNLPALYHDEKSGDISERDILYKVLFEMKKDVFELKKLVLNLLENDSIPEHLLEENKELFNDLDSAPPASTILLNDEKPAELTIDSAPIVQEEDVRDISHVTEDDDLSLEKKEKELIIKALRKHNNKRKYAAKDLGISERTLYRKIKYYQLEE